MLASKEWISLAQRHSEAVLHRGEVFGSFSGTFSTHSFETLFFHVKKKTPFCCQTSHGSQRSATGVQCFAKNPLHMEQCCPHGCFSTSFTSQNFLQFVIAADDIYICFSIYF